MSERSDNLTLWTGTLVSLSLHALVVSVLIVLPPIDHGAGGTSSAKSTEREIILFDPRSIPPEEPLANRDQPKPDPTAAPDQMPAPAAVLAPVTQPLPPPEPRLLALGKDGGNPKLESWIEHKSTDELQAPDSKVDQPALSQHAGNPGQPGTRGSDGAQSPATAPMPDAPGVSLPTPADAEPSRGPIDITKPSPTPAHGSDTPEAKKVEPSDLPVGPKPVDGPAISKPLPDGPEPKGPSAETPREKVDGIARPDSDTRLLNADKPAPGTNSTTDGRDAQTSAAKSAGPNPGEKPAKPTAATTAAAEKLAPKPVEALEKAAAPAPAQQPAPALASPSVNDAAIAPGTVANRPQTPAANKPTSSTSATNAPATPGTPDAGSLGDGRGDPSDRDSDPSVVNRKAKYFRNGRVEAGEGLEIKTVRPQFTLFTQTFALPRNPLIEIFFGKDGRVRSVKVLRSSGYPTEVDDPIVTAAYNWRASGKALTELSERPEAGIKLVINIILTSE